MQKDPSQKTKVGVRTEAGAQNLGRSVLQAGMGRDNEGGGGTLETGWEHRAGKAGERGQARQVR